jgi:fructose-1,6-bisphosphatase/inositol monophosphatase family enzyme
MALEYQGKVKNSGKEIEKLSTDNDFIRKQRAAKTVIDEKVQEELLLAALRLVNPADVYADAEEETPSKKYFSPEPAPTTLVIDPIDGTLLYLAGKDGFSVCVGLIEKGEMLASLVYFPARKEFYFIKDGSVYCETNGKLQKLFAPKIKDSNLMFVNNRVSEQIAGNLIKAGFEVASDEGGAISWPDALIKCIKGEYNACIFHTPQIRDVLIGAMISKMDGGYALDFFGNKIVWPNGGRVPQIIFGFSPISKKIIDTLS